jgi:hypothetical protein
MVSASVFEKSALQVQRQFSSLDVDDTYLKVADLGIGRLGIVDRIPAIRVRMTVKGRGR